MKLKNIYRTITFIAASMICIAVICLNLLFHNKTQTIYFEQTEIMIMDLKKDFLKDTINNIFYEIDALREVKYLNYKKNIEARFKRIKEEYGLTDDEFVKFYIDRFTDKSNPDLWTTLLWNDETGDVLFDTSDLYHESIDNTLEDLKALLSSYEIIEKGNIKGVFGVSKSYIDEIVKKEIGNSIRNRKFSNDSYIWVNEVISYDGGKDYAIRRVHPNLKDTEGTYLSTEMEDVKGNHPYLMELEGIKKDGEIYFSYYFKELNSSEISEKITYAKLYKDYDWIIAMGVHLDDIDAYSDNVKDEVQTLSNASIISLVTATLLVFLFGFIVIDYIQRRHLTTSTRSLVKEINLDTLTKAASRRCGINHLNTYFKRFRLTGERPAIMYFDIDDFKSINDSFGHEVGDIVLIEIVKTVNQIIRSNDQLIRWGGDEFLGILPGLKEDHIRDFSKKLLDGIAVLEIPVENGSIHITVSMGFSYFKASDHDYNDVLKRADHALYKSKEQGKNRVNLLL